MNDITYRAVHVDGIKIFYREAGSKDDPTILLLHGFPSASHMFRDAIADAVMEFLGVEVMM
jgi:pimeloyl-ACP methyl ester carboxylesterase